jgi:hypothetical protein
MWLNRFGIISANINGFAFPNFAGWGVVTSPASLISLNLVRLNSDTSVGRAGGNESSRIPINRKVYLELQSIGGAGVQTGMGFHNPSTPSSTLNSSWVRFYTPNPDPSAGTDETWYLGINSNTTAYGENATGWYPFQNAGAPVLTGWAIDTIVGKIWVTMNGSNWLGGGDPGSGSSPTFTVNLANYTLFSEGFYISAGSIGIANAKVEYNYSNFGYTPPPGFDFNL